MPPEYRRESCTPELARQVELEEDIPPQVGVLALGRRQCGALQDIEKLPLDRVGRSSFSEGQDPAQFGALCERGERTDRIAMECSPSGLLTTGLQLCDQIGDPPP